MVAHVHVVIPVANEPKNPTLPLAIETIRRHTTHDIVTIGHDHGLAQHIPMSQSNHPRDAWANTDRAMRIACELFETFIWSADDIYWTRPAEPIRWAIGHLSDADENRHLPGVLNYARRKKATHAWLAQRGLTTFDYEAHVPIQINANPMLDVLDTITANPLLDKRSMYGNLTGEPDLIAPDVKIRSHDIPDTPWISSDGTAHWDTITEHVHQPA